MDALPLPHVPEAWAIDPVIGRVRTLLDLAAGYGLAELRVQAGDFKLSARSSAPPDADGLVARRPAATAPAGMPAAGDEAVLVLAPMLGTFVAAPHPAAAPYVAVGDVIESGQTIALIEVLKVRHEVPSDLAGTVAEVLVHDGQGVEFGQPLYRIVPESCPSVSAREV